METNNPNLLLGSDLMGVGSFQSPLYTKREWKNKTTKKGNWISRKGDMFLFKYVGREGM